MTAELRERLNRAKQVLAKKDELEAKIRQNEECIRKHEDHLLGLNRTISVDPDSPRVRQGMRLGVRFCLIGLGVALLIFAFGVLPSTKKEGFYPEIVLPIVFAMPAEIVGISLMFSTLSTQRLIRRARDRASAAYDQYYQTQAKPELNRCSSEIIRLRGEVQNLLCMERETLSLLPEEMWSVECADYVMECLENGGAETLNGALTLCAMQRRIAQMEKTMHANGGTAHES